jgi:transposase
MKVQILGIDLAKNVFQLYGVDQRGDAVLTRRLRRDQLMEVLGELEPCLIGIEASTGAFYWQRQFEKLGHTVRIMAPQYVKAIRASAEERYQRRRGDLHSGSTAQHAIRAEEDARTTGHPGAPSRAAAVG